jgi:hypothetical protein
VLKDLAANWVEKIQEQVRVVRGEGSEGQDVDAEAVDKDFYLGPDLDGGLASAAATTPIEPSGLRSLHGCVSPSTPLGP